MRILFKILGLLWMSHTVYAGMIYGVAQAQDKYRHVHYPAYVQMGSFSTMRTAQQCRHHIRLRSKIPVVIQSSRGRYKVVAGPFRNQSALKAFVSKAPNAKHQQRTKQQANHRGYGKQHAKHQPHSKQQAKPQVHGKQLTKHQQHFKQQAKHQGHGKQHAKHQSHSKQQVKHQAPGKQHTKHQLQTSGDFMQAPTSIVTPIPALKPKRTYVKPRQTSLSKEPVVQRQPPARTFAVQHGLYPELSLFLGGSYVPNTIRGQTLQLMPYEIGPYADTFNNQGSGSGFTWGLDAKYRFMLHEPSRQDSIVDSIGAGVDFFQITDFNQTGNVAQFNMPEFENYTYTLGLSNIRIMADFDLDFHPIRQYFTPFIEAGLGAARTVLSYNSVPISPVVSPNFTLPNQASWNFAYQAGAGVKYAATTQIVLSLRYLYANMGKSNSSISGSTTTLATPLTATMSTQNFLVGLTYLVE